MSFEENKKSYMDTLFSISTLLKRWQIEIQNKDVDKIYMVRRLGQWIEQLESLKHEIMMGKDK
jgi:hydroxymethylpyrimidine pyrophosphatase-like HAD family hydrolase|tara:strand:- start:322 stop:510 length:189 start_codon:yes stop_codon:yes gene_type:complete